MNEIPTNSTLRAMIRLVAFGLILAVIDGCSSSNLYHSLIVYPAFVHLVFCFISNCGMTGEISANLARFEELSALPRYGTLWTKKGEIL